LFSGSSSEWNKNQIVLASWLKQYAQVEEFDKFPGEHIVDSDFEFDRWLTAYINEMEQKRLQMENTKKTIDGESEI
jgi:hypothetical protein